MWQIIILINATLLIKMLITIIRENYCGVPLIFGELCRMIDFYVGNEYVLINRRFSEYVDLLVITEFLR